MIAFTEKGKPEGKDLNFDSGKRGAVSIWQTLCEENQHSVWEMWVIENSKMTPVSGFQ